MKRLVAACLVCLVAGAVALRLASRGQTLPLDHVVYNSLEVGISAHVGARTAVLYVDDVFVGTRRAKP